LKRLSYVEAIHETGARLTHDVKNLLQSLDALCAAAELDGSLNSSRFNALVRRQLPEISLRLHQTLAKLNAPGKPMPSSRQTAEAWLASLMRRYELAWLEFSAGAMPAECTVADAALFSSIVENLLQNIVEKRHNEPNLRAIVRVLADRGMPSVEVEDDGRAIPEGVAKRLFAYNTTSNSGFGIGLYQSAHLAEQAGYRLELTENRDGCVRFSLMPQASGR
jgi:signal transduction histidine kinase